LVAATFTILSNFANDLVNSLLLRIAT